MPFMVLGLYIITAIIAFIAAFLFIWSKQTLHHRLHKHFLGGNNNIYGQELMILHHIKKCLCYLYKESRLIRKSPELTENMLERLKLLLAPKLILSEQRTLLRNVVQNLYKNHMLFYARQNKLSKDNYTRTVALANDLNMLSSVKNNLDLLDMKVQAQAQKTHRLFHLAQSFAAAHRIKHFRSCIKVAKEFQDSNIKIVKAVQRAERRVSSIRKKYNSIKGLK